MHDCIDIRGVPKGGRGNKGGRAPKDLIEFAEGQLLFGGGVQKILEAEQKILGTPFVFLPPSPQIFSLHIPLVDNGDISFHVFSQFFCFLMQK